VSVVDCQSEWVGGWLAELELSLAL
jgi:hypothetical protein